MNPRKVAAIRDSGARPTSCTEVRRFVELANYYQRFARQFSSLAAPLTSLCSPLATFRRSDTEQQSFEALRAALMSAPVLRVWDPGLPTRLTTDESELVGDTRAAGFFGRLSPDCPRVPQTHRPGARIPTSIVGSAGGGPLPQVFPPVPVEPFL